MAIVIEAVLAIAVILALCFGGYYLIGLLRRSDPGQVARAVKALQDGERRFSQAADRINGLADRIEDSLLLSGIEPIECASPL